MKIITFILFVFSVNTFGFNKSFSGYLFKIKNKIYISKSAELNARENLIELDLYESKDLCFKNINKFCQVSQVVYESEQKESKRSVFKNAHLQKASENMLSKQIKIQNIPMH